ncbi:dynein heavy chain, putative [Perkinsus marinus ATCC 50983]|uniref:Dynein heavy chain, putative n=1 Tax=Perkinsus marinus (strain ATCC 50983 / TXsc) TaxID=423536 RepID=C5LBD7_PERM5|nr:dynein heavy chain, putative [Perkinsus marinus ATCC 50983]EER06065.1 dynein heavy chain, putative [Perkinsus marinus ATCC 50983]|eukprot:XP_002774249.1 dynein heavy chain, putative [Perkinsus marinus ATCC 50983]
MSSLWRANSFSCENRNHGGVVLVAQALCYFFGVKPNKVPAPDGRGKVEDFWEPAKKELLGDPRLLDRLINFDKDNISEEAMKKVKPLYDDPNFEPEVIKKASIAAMGICKWARAMVVYDKVAKEVGPKRAALAEAEGKAAAAKAKLAEKEAELAEVIALVDKLVSDLNNAKEYMEELQKQRDDCAAKLVRAEKLITGLGGEKSRWTAASNRLGTDYNNLSGDILIASGIIAYLGVFTASYRSDVMVQWLGKLQELKIPASPQFNLQNCIGDAVKIRQWVIDKLPNDGLSIDNAIIMSNSRRWPLMIDPQQQANKWIKNMEKNLQVLRLTKNYARELENAIQFGNPVLIENIAESLDPMLDPLLQKATFKQGNLEMIRLGDSTIEWSKDFRLYFTTKLPNPHYAPEICVSVTILNFMATVDGLQDQMLGIVVAKEEPEIEAKRVSLVVESAQSKAQLKEIEDRILALLSSATGNILDDEELIETLSNSKIASQKIEEQVQQQERTAAQIQETRQAYRPLALRSASLFFVVSDLCIVDPMYQYSLDWFIMIFIMSIDQAEAANSPADRMANLASSTIRLLYVMVCRSLFEAHRLLYSMQLAFKMQEVDKELNFKQMRLFLTGGGGGGAPSEEKPPNTAWLTDISWGRVLELAKLGETFDGFQEAFKSQVDGWKAIFDSDNPRDVEWPNSFDKKCTPLEKALVLLAIRADALVPAIQEIVEKKLGNFFLEPPPFDLEACYNDSRPSIPLVFVLSSGSDPMADIIKLAEGKDMLANISAISLGQGQGPKAMAALEEGTKLGKWVLLQNCHLAVSWMPVLEKVVEDFREDEINLEFRLWLTAMPSPAFPISVLQNGIKMTLEPPKGLKNSLVRAYMGMDEEWFESCSKPHAFKKLLFGLCFFHAVILERRQFGPLGWNIPYQFSEPDRDISRQQLKNFLDEFEGIPWKALSYMVAEANYGGRVTDAQDRRAIVHILTDYYTERILKDEYKFSISGTYFAPKEGTLSSYMEYIRGLPINQTPEVFWLHNNANLTAAINEGMEILRTAVMLMPKTGGGDSEEGEKEKTPEEIYGEKAAEIVASLPKNFDVDAVQRTYPVRYDQCLNTVLVQELLKCNKLLDRLRDTLVNLQKAVKGLVVFSPDLEEVAEGLLSNKVPSVWAKVSYPSLKPLGSYVADFLQRLQFFDGWVESDAPSVFWFSGFFFQQAFLTGVLQNFARKDKIAIDRCIWNMEVLKADNTSPGLPEKGCIIRGLFMDGARWDDEKMVIADSFPKVLFSEVPYIWLKPVEMDRDETKYGRIYTCPVYKTSERRGTLSTSGHSTNHVMMIFLPIAAEHDETFWVKRGVAMLTQIDD